MRPERGILAGACLALGLLAGRLGADNGSPEQWLDGTRAWDSTPQEEADVQMLSGFGDHRPSLGAGLRAGLTDTLQASGQWLPALPGGQDSAELGLKWRLDAPPGWLPGLAAYGRAPWSAGAWSWRGGLAAEWDPLDGSLALNAEAGEAGAWGLRAAALTPYLLYTLRLGVEAAWQRGGAAVLTPQLALNFPGDVSLDLGLRLDPGHGDQRWLLRFSYELFPSPPAFPDDASTEKKP
jgi:hypothetical protein